MTILEHWLPNNLENTGGIRLKYNKNFLEPQTTPRGKTTVNYWSPSNTTKTINTVTFSPRSPTDTSPQWPGSTGHLKSPIQINSYLHVTYRDKYRVTCASGSPQTSNIRWLWHILHPQIQSIILLNPQNTQTQKTQLYFHPHHINSTTYIIFFQSGNPNIPSHSVLGLQNTHKLSSKTI